MGIRTLWLQKNIPNLLLFQGLDYGSYSAVDNIEENSLSKLQQMQLIRRTQLPLKTILDFITTGSDF